MQFVETRERGVQVCLVENLVAVDQIAADREEADPAPFGVETFL